MNRSGDLSFNAHSEGYVTLNEVDERYHTRLPGQYIIVLGVRKRRTSIEWCDVDHIITRWEAKKVTTWNHRWMIRGLAEESVNHDAQTIRTTASGRYYRV